MVEVAEGVDMEVEGETETEATATELPPATRATAATILESRVTVDTTRLVATTPGTRVEEGTRSAWSDAHHGPCTGAHFYPR